MSANLLQQSNKTSRTVRQHYVTDTIGMQVALVNLLEFVGSIDPTINQLISKFNY